jgi:hypothetical protein
MLQQSVSNSTRLESRVEKPEDVWVLWQCDGREVVSPVRDISVGGLFIETQRPRSAGAVANLYFLVPDGPIRINAVVRHATPDGGVGLKFTAVGAEDRRKLIALVSRLRRLPRSRGNCSDQLARKES